MRTPSPGFRPVPTPLAGALLAIATVALPRSDRDRYHAEFAAELCTLPRRRQIISSASILAGTFSLRQALHDPEKGLTVTPTKPLSCRIGRHHYQKVNDDNPENRAHQHLECARCGKFHESKDDDEYPREHHGFYIPIGGGGM